MARKIILCNSWQKLLKEVMRATADFESRWNSPSAVPFFRGHSSSNYQLLPGLFRPNKNGFYNEYDEKNFYYEFRARAGSLLNPSYSSWDVLFLMQHHRVPTRLLDWTESFATALYFALEGAVHDIDIWMLDPYSLNKHTANEKNILDVEADLKIEYFDLFIEPKDNQEQPNWTTVAIYPRRQIARLASQHGLFTLHNDRQPLENASVPGLLRFRLSGVAAAEARRLLKVLGVNDFSLFPDLDGLSKFLRERISGGYAARA
jgi:hypothetical protein